MATWQLWSPGWAIVRLPEASKQHVGCHEQVGAVSHSLLSQTLSRGDVLATNLCDTVHRQMLSAAGGQWKLGTVA